MEKRDLNILIVGVGGQGSLVTSKVLGNIAIYQGLQCKISEIHGMSQRGGSVSTHIKIGEKVFSPVIDEGDVDALISLELMETLRWVHYLKRGGSIIYSNLKINPLSVIAGEQSYPIINQNLFVNKGYSTIEYDALSLKDELGSIKPINMVLLGAFAKKFNIELDVVKQAVSSVFSKKYLQEINLKAIEMGYFS